MYSYYTVQPKEGFYRLKINTGLEQNELERLNPGLATSGLKEGMVLKIPFDANVRAKNEGLGITLAGEKLYTSDLTTRNLDTQTKHVAIMLPFKLMITTLKKRLCRVLEISEVFPLHTVCD